MKKMFLSLAAILFAGYAIANFAGAQTALLPIPSGVGTSGQLLAVSSDGNNVQGTSTPSVTTIAATTSVTIGSGTAVTKITAFAPVLAPSVVAANSCNEQSFTVTGIDASDKLIVNPPAYAGTTNVNATAVAARESGANTVAITFCNVAANSESGRAGTYNIIALRT